MLIFVGWRLIVIFVVGVVDLGFNFCYLFVVVDIVGEIFVVSYFVGCG